MIWLDILFGVLLVDILFLFSSLRKAGYSREFIISWVVDLCIKLLSVSSTMKTLYAFELLVISCGEILHQEIANDLNWRFEKWFTSNKYCTRLRMGQPMEEKWKKNEEQQKMKNKTREHEKDRKRTNEKSETNKWKWMYV